MAKPTSLQACLDRHREYEYDIALRLDEAQVIRLRAMADLIPIGTVLDIGCNSGIFSTFIPDCQVTGVDISPHLVAIANRSFPAYVAPAEDLPFDDNSFDTAVLGEILEHVYSPLQVLREAERVAKNSIVGSVPHEHSEWGMGTIENHPHHVRYFTRESLLETLSSVWGTVEIKQISNFYVFRVAL